MQHDEPVRHPRGAQPEPAVRGREPVHDRPRAHGGRQPGGRRLGGQAAHGVRRGVRQRRRLRARPARQREPAAPQAVRQQGPQARRGRVPSRLPRVHGRQRRRGPALLELGPPGPAGRQARAGRQRGALGRLLHGDPDGGRAPVPRHHDQRRGAHAAAATRDRASVAAQDSWRASTTGASSPPQPSAASPSAWA